MRICTYYN